MSDLMFKSNIAKKFVRRYLMFSGGRSNFGLTYFYDLLTPTFLIIW